MDSFKCDRKATGSKACAISCARFCLCFLDVADLVGCWSCGYEIREDRQKILSGRVHMVVNHYVIGDMETEITNTTIIAHLLVSVRS